MYLKGKMVIELDEKNFKKEVNLSKVLVLLDFYAEWCQPCQMMKPVFAEISEEKEFAGRLKFAKIDVGKNSDTADLFNVQGVPALLFIREGQEVDRIVGFGSKEALRKKIRDIVKELEEKDG